MDIISILGFILLGIAVATLGTIIGAGGGIIFVPVFLYFFPEWTPAMVVGTSLFTVTCNAISGTVAYVKQKKILYSAAILFSIATFPGSIVGAHVAEYFDPSGFRFWFGSFLLIMSGFIGYKNMRKGERKEESLQLEAVSYTHLTLPTN